jgi:phage terminase large subunit
MIFMQASLNPKLQTFWTTTARNRVLYGGRSSSKSWDAAGWIIFLASSSCIRVLCVRQFQNKIAESVYTLLKIQITRFKLEHKFKILRNSIVCTTTGSEFIFYGLARNIDEIKSVEGIDILWSEESHLITKIQWDILEPTIRKQGSQCWLIFNPRLVTDFVWKRFVVNPPPNTIVRKINYIDNPFLSQTMIDVIEATKHEDVESYTHIYLGEPLADDDQAIIKRSWILAAIDAHHYLNRPALGEKRIGFDVADSGDDACSTIETHGHVVTGAEVWKAKEDELLKSCARVYNRARTTRSRIIYDCIGVGAGCGAKFKETNAMLNERVKYDKFNAGGAIFKPEAIYQHGIKNKDMFSNVKAQAWWLLADRFKNTYNAVMHGQKFNDDQIISINADLPHLSLLIDELSTPKRDFDANGRVKVESKKDLKKRGIDSPNCADALVCAYAPLIKPMIINL